MVQFNGVDDITLGARYKDLITGFEGIAVAKSEQISGCDRITLEQTVTNPGEKLQAYNIDVTSLVYVDEGISKMLAEHRATNPTPEKLQKGALAEPADIH